MKIYTKKGDAGMTALADGRKVAKNEPAVSLYGTVDELNSVIGAAVSHLDLSKNRSDALREDLKAEQCLLFELGSELAGFKYDAVSSIILESDIENLEKRIDAYSENLPELRVFILPGGHPSASMLHVARTVCRRLEREMTEIYLSEKKEESLNFVHPPALKYINRLSDYLFTSARYANFLHGEEDVSWKSRLR